MIALEQALESNNKGIHAFLGCLHHDQQQHSSDSDEALKCLARSLSTLQQLIVRNTNDGGCNKSLARPYHLLLNSSRRITYHAGLGGWIFGRPLTFALPSCVTDYTNPRSSLQPTEEDDHHLLMLSLAGVVFNMALVCQTKGQWVKAVRLYSKALECIPEPYASDASACLFQDGLTIKVMAWNNRAVLLRALKRTQPFQRSADVSQDSALLVVLPWLHRHYLPLVGLFADPWTVDCVFQNLCGGEGASAAA